jgi:hypothetical protein
MQPQPTYCEPLVAQDDGGDDWAGQTEYGHEIVARRRGDTVELSSLLCWTIELTPSEAKRLAAMLTKAARTAP